MATGVIPDTREGQLLTTTFMTLYALYTTLCMESISTGGANSKQAEHCFSANVMQTEIFCFCTVMVNEFRVSAKLPLGDISTSASQAVAR